MEQVVVMSHFLLHGLGFGLIILRGLCYACKSKKEKKKKILVIKIRKIVDKKKKIR